MTHEQKLRRAIETAAQWLESGHRPKDVATYLRAALRDLDAPTTRELAKDAT